VSARSETCIATLFFSRGVPMLLAGDELGRTQQGNNNAYCQDNEISWVDWGRMDWDLAAFVQKISALRRELPIFRAAKYLHDITWLTPHGGPMSEADWSLPYGRCLGALFGDEVLLLLNSHDGDIPFALPEGAWQLALDTAGEAEQILEGTYLLQSRSLALLLKPRP
jgi:pullulanase/glycogen debranching enzyme